MLYNPKWLDETKPIAKSDVFSLESLIAWLEKQPGDKVYEFTDCASCALAQYFASHGFTEINMGTESFDHGPNFRYEASLPAGWNDLVNPRRASRGWNTFGAVLKRARSALSCTLPSPD